MCSGTPLFPRIGGAGAIGRLWRVEGIDLPLPPRDLASRVFGVEGWSDPDRAYLELGKQTKEQIVRLLPGDWSFVDKRVLDFGSGAGRTLRHFTAEAESAEFWGCDIDERSIAWLEANLCPPFHAWRSAHNPPLGLEHESFDLIYAVSVFTHLSYNSTAWLLELHRMLKPEGLLIATFMGRWISDFFAGEPWVEDRVGMNVLHHNRDWDSGGPAVLISEWWLREHWGRAFEILTLEPQFQNFSWVLARKRDVSVTTEEVERPSTDPREFVALRHHVAQVQNELVRELEHQQRLCETALRDQAEDFERRSREYEAALRAYEATVQSYDTSLSWKATRPLRAASRRLRKAPPS